jgi:enoyl-CoA hydratase
MNLIEALPVPVIAAVNGYALGGRFEIALAADFIYASSSARMGLPEVGLGIIPGFGGVRRLCWRIGIARTKELVYTGRQVAAAEAERFGALFAGSEPAEGMTALLEKRQPAWARKEG